MADPALGHRLEVETGAKTPARPIKDRDVGLLVLVEGQKRVDKRPGMLPIDRIADLRTVQNDDCDRASALDTNRHDATLPVRNHTIPYDGSARLTNLIA